MGQLQPLVVGADGKRYGPADVPTLLRWVQEGRLLSTVRCALPIGRQPAAARLHAAWRARQLATWNSAMEVLAQRRDYRAALSQRRDGANVLFYGEQNK